jgi:hypothetical protein
MSESPKAPMAMVVDGLGNIGAIIDGHKAQRFA